MRVLGWIGACSRWLSVALVAALAAGNAAAQERGAWGLPPAGEHLIGGAEYIGARHEDTLLDIARRFDLGYNEMRLANPGVDVWLPGEGTRITLPRRFLLPQGTREGIVLNVPEKRLYFFPEDGPGIVITHPVSVGRGEWQTPVGGTTLVAKQRDPAWYPTESIRAEYAAEGDPLPRRVPPGPDNPLGRYALRLGLPGYLIHGTNNPYGIGMEVTHGCVRLYPEDIERLFARVDVGTPVRIVNQPFKVGWHRGMLYLEAHRPVAFDRDAPVLDVNPLVEQIIRATEGRPDYPVDWQRAKALARRPDGMPHPIGKRPIADMRVAETLSFPLSADLLELYASGGEAPARETAASGAGGPKGGAGQEAAPQESRQPVSGRGAPGAAGGGP